MTNRRARLQDVFDLQSMGLDKGVLEQADEMLQKGRDAALLIESKATYSGYLLNGRVYPGRYMKDGVKTWCDAKHGGTSQFCKPVLVGHDVKDGSPIGRVVQATFHQLLDGDRFLKDFETPVRTPGPGASGYTNLTMRITHPDAVQRFLRGEYLTFSTNFSTSMYVCSICGTDMHQEEWCGHEPGESYEIEGSDEKVECYFVSGPMDYIEVSVVNSPAQPQAKVEKMSMADQLATGVLSGPSTKRNAKMVLKDASGAAIDLTKALTKKPRKGALITVMDDLDDTTSEDTSKKELLKDANWPLAAVAGQLRDLKILNPDAAKVGDIYFLGLTQIVKGDIHAHGFFGQIDTDTKKCRVWTDRTFPLTSDQVEPHYHSGEDEVKSLDVSTILMKTTASEYVDHQHDLLLVMKYSKKSKQDVQEALDKFQSCLHDDEHWKHGDAANADSLCGPFGMNIPDEAHLQAALALIPFMKVSDAQRDALLLDLSRRWFEVNPDAIKDLKPMTQPTPAAAPALTDDQKRLQTLTDQLGASQTQIKTLEAAVASSKADADRLTKSLSDAEASLHSVQCERLALLRVLGNRAPGATSADVKELAKTFANRLPASISDAIADEIGVLDQALSAMKGVKTLLGKPENQNASAPAGHPDTTNTPAPANTPAPGDGPAI